MLNITKTKTINRTDKNAYSPNFKGPIDGILTKGLTLLDTNPMLNASAVDIFAMDTPRTIVEFKERNKYAGAEMAFREYTGTFIAEFSAGLFAILIQKLASKRVKPNVKVNNNSWVTNNTIDVFNDVWQKSSKTPENFVHKVFDNMYGINGENKTSWKMSDFSTISWFDKNKWRNFKWQNEKFKGLEENIIKTGNPKENIEKLVTRLITDNSISKNDAKNILNIISMRITNGLGAERNIVVNSGQKSVSAPIQNILRDVVDMGKNVFSSNSEEIAPAIGKLKKINGIKIGGALALSTIIALSNQVLNRYITNKRTGSSEFVGNNGYVEDINKKDKKSSAQKNLPINKALASLGFVFMLSKVMNVKSLKGFAQKLEFTGPTTSGNAIKTVYGALILGRFLASKDNTELRETVVRDYLGFLNWLVFGGFVAKGVAQLFDKKQNALFNIQKSGNGIKHWLQDVSLKTHAEIAAQGGRDVAKNIKKLNIAHLSGIAYSALMLGVVLPKLNIAMTKKSQNNVKNNKWQNTTPSCFINIEKQLMIK
ncbi:MAG: hypothetical protein PHV37_06970 [Candidatus Gastranaerophilales bacterium]|nr:hypothetical protein [Candidatus Gastranaerophilales bacterium]